MTLVAIETIVLAIAGGATGAAVVSALASRRLTRSNADKNVADTEHILVDASGSVIAQLVEEQQRFRIRIDELAAGLAACELREVEALERDRLSRKREVILRTRIEELETEVKALTIWTPGRTHLPDRKDMQ